jgi:DNA-binding XRE family transcriptional regulator
MCAIQAVSAHVVRFFRFVSGDPDHKIADTQGIPGPDRPMKKKTKSKHGRGHGYDVDDEVMSPLAFRRWRRSLRLSQKEAAEALGLKRRVVQYYEKGERDGEPVVIPKTVRLACYALTAGQMDYPGPGEG